MTHENDTILIRTLIESYRGQLERYCGLRDTARQVMSRLVLSRGDLSQVTEGLMRKKELLEAIETERSRVAREVAWWQERKAQVEPCAETETFEGVLRQISDAIQEFLEDEAQLRRYLEGVVSRSVAS